MWFYGVQMFLSVTTRFPDVAPEQFEGRDNTCMVCREEMALNCKMLPCGHIFHAACLRSWFQRQQVCPTCTTSVLTATREQQALMQQQNNRLRAQREQQQPNEPQPGQFLSVSYVRTSCMVRHA